jgi:hypothetical protein
MNEHSPSSPILELWLERIGRKVAKGKPQLQDRGGSFTRPMTS